MAGRSGGYSVSWNSWVEGTNAQAHFDRMVAELAAGALVLDCGCGDGAFTFEMATVARHVVGLDYSEGMLNLARKGAAERGFKNTT